MSAVLQPAMEQTADLSEQALVEQWLTRFNEALIAEPNTNSAASIAALFATESHWRDLLAYRCAHIDAKYFGMFRFADFSWILLECCHPALFGTSKVNISI